MSSALLMLSGTSNEYKMVNIKRELDNVLE